MNLEADTETLTHAADIELLGQRLEQARAQRDELERELADVDAQLDAFGAERRRHELLEQACRALEQLRDAGGADLFWDGLVAGESARADQLANARARIAEAHARIGDIDAYRTALLDRIGRHNEEIYLLEDEAFEHREEAERRLDEWIVERELDEVRARPHLMPWHKGEEDKRWRRGLLVALLLWLLIVIVAPFVKIPKEEQAKPQPPERVVTIIPETKKLELPPPPPEPKKQVEKKIEPKPVAQEQPKPQETPQPNEQPQPQKPQGILALKDKLTPVDDIPDAPQLGKNAKISNDDGASHAERSMLTTNAPGSSGGINLSEQSRGFGKGGGSERGSVQGSGLTKASSGINALAAAAESKPLGGMAKGRSSEEIQIVFDHSKAALYRMYQKELRNDETLQGKVILKLTIQPDGSVSACAVQSTEMNDPALMQQIVERVKTFNFGAKDVPAVTIVYPMNFLPAG